MKVMCIRNKPWIAGKEHDSLPLSIAPKFGEIVTVLETGVAPSGWATYRLREYPRHDYCEICWWPQHSFAPLSEIEEENIYTEKESISSLK